MASKGRSARDKGRRAETEFVEILNSCGVPTQKVLASGSFIGAKGDVKVGVKLNPDGTFPAADESSSKMRVEIKNRKTTPEQLFNRDAPVFAYLDYGKEASEVFWTYYNQDKVTKAVVLRRAKIPSGVLKNKDYNQAYMVCMGLDDFVELFKKAYPDVCK